MTLVFAFVSPVCSPLQSEIACIIWLHCPNLHLLTIMTKATHVPIYIQIFRSPSHCGKSEIFVQKLKIQHFCTKLEYFQDKTQTKVQKQKMEFWTQNSILPQCAFIAKVWITLHGWVGFYWVVKPRHISTWTVDMNRAYFPSHLIPIDDPGLWFKSSPSMFAQKTFTTSRLQNKSWGFLHTSKLFDDSKL